MRIILKKLKLNCQTDPIEIPFDPIITFFHGQTAAGKSTIFKLIDFCLGGKFPDTTAVQEEVISVELHLLLSNKNYIFERSAEQLHSISIHEVINSELANSFTLPLSASTKRPIIDPDIYNFSDFILKTLDLPRLIVPYGQKGRSARLSFRDIMWYCYLSQEELDSSFFHMDHRYERLKSQYVIRLIVGNYTEDLNMLKMELNDNIKNQNEIKNMIKNTNKFLEYFEYSSENEIYNEIKSIESRMNELKLISSENKKSYRKDTFFVNDLQQEVSQLINESVNETKQLNDLQYQIQKHENFKSEMEYNKIKLLRAESATSILSGSKFEICPECGIKLSVLSRPEKSCTLCGSSLHDRSSDNIDTSIALQDIDIRIKEIQELIDLHHSQIEIQKRKIPKIQSEIDRLNDTLDSSLKDYDSRYLSNNILIEKEISANEERLKNLYNNLEIPNNLKKLEEEINFLKKKEYSFKLNIEHEESKIKISEENIAQIMTVFKDVLLSIKTPHVNEGDVIILNRKTWIPEIRIGGDEKRSWDFFNAGSAGLKTLLTVSYALAIHIIAEKNNLPLPRILLIDTPMSNIGEEVNQDMFIAFYEYIYNVLKDQLKSTQIIIIDKQFVKPRNGIIPLERFMTIDDPRYPPLFPKYNQSI